jgi:hypothetical protein
MPRHSPPQFQPEGRTELGCVATTGDVGAWDDLLEAGHCESGQLSWQLLMPARSSTGDHAGSSGDAQFLQHPSFSMLRPALCFCTPGPHAVDAFQETPLHIVSTKVSWGAGCPGLAASPAKGYGVVNTATWDRTCTVTHESHDCRGRCSRAMHKGAQCFRARQTVTWIWSTHLWSLKACRPLDYPIFVCVCRHAPMDSLSWSRYARFGSSWPRL